LSLLACDPQAKFLSNANPMVEPRSSGTIAAPIVVDRRVLVTSV